ncbi:MAG: C-terminal binding protein [Alkalispirochaetaceae bacterium]
MNRPRVAIIDDRFDAYREEEKLLTAAGSEYRIFSLAPGDPLPDWVEEADGIVVNLYPLDRQRIYSLKRCRGIARYGVGYDTVDASAAAERGITTAIVPDYLDDEVATHAAALLLSCARDITYRDRQVREGRWNVDVGKPLHRLAGSTLGIIGYGVIGAKLWERLRPFRFRELLIYDPTLREEEERESGGRKVPLKTLLARSDYVSLHCPLNEATYQMIDASALSLMKPTAALVNTARGGIVDESALLAALEAGKLRVAALDVYEREPLPEESGLKRCERVILSDHAAYYSEESLSTLKRRATENILDILGGRKPNVAVAGPLAD